MKYVAPRDNPATEETPEPPYVDENPTAGISGSVVPAEYFNTIQREILNVIEGALITPNVSNRGQLLEAILALIDAGGEPGGEGGGPWALAARQIIAGLGLSGGGSLEADRTLALDLSELPAVETLDAADRFALHKVSAGAPRTITYENLLGLIAAAISVTPETVGAIDAVGSYVLCGLANGGAMPGAGSGNMGGGAASGIVSGSALSPARPGTWRCHGFINVPGVVIDNSSGWSPGGGLAYTNIRFGLFLRIS